MLPDRVTTNSLYWKGECPEGRGLEPYILDTELLHLCWLVEETLDKHLKEDTNSQRNLYYYELTQECGSLGACHATWQQRTIALAKTKGIEIV